MNIEQAKQIPLENILGFFGHQPVRQTGGQLWYCSPLREETTPSFKVNPSLNLWYDFGDGRHGDSIDLVTQLCHLGSVSEALGEIERLVGRPHETPHPGCVTPGNDNQADRSPKLTVTGNLPITAKALKMYLHERGIPLAIAKTHLRELHYRRGEHEYFALALENQSGGFEIRSRHFKGSLGSKDISVLPGPTHRVYLFEGMMDYLTALTMFRGSLDGTAIVLNSVVLKERAAELIRTLHPAVVELYRDHDAAGAELKDTMQRELPGITIVDWADLYAGHNDLNAWHVARQQSRSI